MTKDYKKIARTVISTEIDGLKKLINKEKEIGVSRDIEWKDMSMYNVNYFRYKNLNDQYKNIIKIANSISKLRNDWFLNSFHYNDEYRYLFHKDSFISILNVNINYTYIWNFAYISNCIQIILSIIFIFILSILIFKHYNSATN